MLQPNSQWKWYLDSNQHLLIQLTDELHFQTSLQTKHLKPDAELALPKHFDCEQHHIFQTVSEILELYKNSFSDAQALQILLNATAVTSFHKEISMKNWLFEDGMAIQDCGLAHLATNESKGQVLVVSLENDVADCITLDDSFSHLGKKYGAFMPVKVSSSKLTLVEIDQTNHAIAC